MPDNIYSFKPRARLLLQLGDQLIRNESIALLEIIKNSYDACATKATVTMKNLENPQSGEIIIEDNGDGMDFNIIKDVWLHPGTEHKIKPKGLDDNNVERPSCDRIPIGGKGIGRFGAHKLGFHIEVISKKKNADEVLLVIDWKDFEQDLFLEDVKVAINTHPIPTYFKEGKTSGTKITIRQLKGNWTRGTVRELYRAVNSLNSPFETKDAFKAYFKVDNQDWLKGLIGFKEIEDHALYYAEAVIEGDKLKTLDYEFRPWDTMNKLHGRKETLSNVDMVKIERNETTKKKEQCPIDIGKHKIGTVTFKLLIFDRSGKILSLGVTDKKGFKDYLDLNGGVRVFRDGIRVYDYGEPDNDWLNLDLMRVNQPGKTISNNIIIGAVGLENRLVSEDLLEKTNREGFVENEAYNDLVDAIRFTLDKVLTQRNIDKELVRKFYSNTGSSEPVISRLQSLHEKISDRVKDVELKSELLKSISDIEKDYNTINEIYTRSSSAGLSLSIVMHEIIHMIAELSSAVEHKVIDNHIRGLVKTLQKTTSDYAGVIKQSNKTKARLGKVISQALSNIQFRIKAHDVEIIRNFERSELANKEISCAQNLVTSTLINIIDNSIWWQTYAKTPNKKVFIDIVDEPDKYTSILIADNGPGFSLPPEEAIKPFISDKPGGMGLGLHLAAEVMNGQKGRLLFPDEYDFEMPEEFQKGAKLLLAFRKAL
ncbi:MAG: ATP-binding protein [Cyclobacteriaceae bacterium]|nr:ATP-binding protein [Cyclobacteriaceae bacterium]